MEDGSGGSVAEETAREQDMQPNATHRSPRPCLSTGWFMTRLLTTSNGLHVKAPMKPAHTAVTRCRARPCDTGEMFRPMRREDLVHPLVAPYVLLDVVVGSQLCCGQRRGSGACGPGSLVQAQNALFASCRHVEHTALLVRHTCEQ